jgi:hypothetical protein
MVSPLRTRTNCASSAFKELKSKGRDKKPKRRYPRDRLGLIAPNLLYQRAGCKTIISGVRGRSFLWISHALPPAFLTDAFPLVNSSTLANGNPQRGVLKCMGMITRGFNFRAVKVA